MLNSFLSFLTELKRRLSDFTINESKAHLLALLLILALAVTVRVRFLFEPMRYDEAYTFLTYASKPLHIGLTKYWTNNHLLNTFLMHVACSIFGNKPWVLRLPVLLAGTLVVPAIYLAVRALYDKHAAILAAGVAASSSALVEYSVNARGYIYVCLFFLLTLALATHIRQNANPGAWGLFSLFAALGFYSLPTMLYPFGVVASWLFLSIILQSPEQGRGTLLKRYSLSLLLAGLLTALLYLPVLVVSGLQSITENDVVAKDFVSETLSEYLPEFWATLDHAWHHWHVDIPIAIKFLLMAGFAVAMVFHMRLTPHRVPLPAAVLLWLIPVLAIQRVSPPIRIWLFLFPCYVALACGGIGGMFNWGLRNTGRYQSVVIAVAALVISLWLGVNVLNSRSVASPEGTLDDAEQITFFLKDYLKPGDRIIATAGAASIVEYYFTLHGVPVEYLHSDARFGNRIVVVVNESKRRADEILSQRGASVIENLHKAFPNYSEAKLIKRYQFATLYELYKMRGEHEN
jgi:hypothetical protein